MSEFVYFWFRRDLRTTDNHGLYQALNSGYAVKCVFVFDRDILDLLEKPADARVEFIHRQITQLNHDLMGNLEVHYGSSREVWKQLLGDPHAKGLYVNRDYEASAIERDLYVEDLCKASNKTYQSYKDQVIFEQNEVVKDDGNPYTVFTPYMKKWKLRLSQQPVIQYPSENHLNQLLKFDAPEIPSLESMGFAPTGMEFPPTTVEQGRIRKYEEQRDIPSILGTTRLSVHFRFGTVSIREKFEKGQSLSEKWINELIWREFYMQILWHFPRVENESFKPQYDRIEWINNPNDFERWKSGTTGYPLVDAGMRELNATGFMHNRVRMVVASFLTKHLLIDWRWGEAYFAQKLLDFELASNNGGWQWAAGSGVDAAPYFRVFNPTTQLEKFDAQSVYVKKWVPEFGTPKYPRPMVDHASARLRCLETYKKALG
ncbi:MAG: DNA photolyase family protein [Bacteroidia bacterium]|nr:DNA photolyase family protein [Bacteroidia bacterium]